MQEEDNNSKKEKEVRKDIKIASDILKKEIIAKEKELNELKKELLYIENDI